MPAPYGVTPTGFNAKTLAEVRADLVAAARRVFGPAANTDSRARLGQLIDIVSEPLADVWNLGTSLANALNPNAATGQQADFIAALTGTTRKAAAATRVTLYLLGTAGTVVPATSRVGQPGTSALFATNAPATITTVADYAFAPGTSIAYGTLAKNTASNTIWRARNSGALATGTFPVSPGTSFVDGGVTWDLLATGFSAAAEVTADCTVTGAIQAFAGSCTVINSPVAGWSAVTNFLDAVVGNATESDTSMRLRRLLGLASAGKSPVDALRANILKTSGVTTCTIFENTGDVTVSFLPPHSIEALVEGGLDADIRATIFANKAGGIATSGSTSGTVTASDGVGHIIAFSRPTLVPIYTALAVQKDPARFPTDGVTQLQTAVQAAISALTVGADVYATRLAAAAFSVPGVLSATATVGTAPSPAAASVSIDVRSRASNSGSVVVTATDGAP